MAPPDAITPARLERRIGLPDAPVLIDLCLDEDFALDPVLIPGARRVDHRDTAGLRALADRGPVVAICQKGRKLSQGVAALLRAEGRRAEYLEGGMVGWRALGGAPALAAAALPAPVEGRTLWVTRHRPKIDRIACPWLIRRFIDRDAAFLFVAPAEVDGVAARFGATPFDTEGAHFGHRGAGCTFDTMLAEFGLATPALEAMATVIRAADTDRHALAPEAAGLLALSVGLSRQFSDDSAQMEAGLAVYDALYRWARDGRGEGHRST